jgi:hypothetical protein
MAQENDDMYFNSKDRAKLNALKPAPVPHTVTFNDEGANSEDDDITLASNYSSRNINPEYTSRSNSQLAQDDNGDYFVNDYRFSTSNSLNTFNNNYNNWYNRPWYNSSYYYGSMANAWNSPYGNYYNGYNSPNSYYYDYYNNPWSNPYYQSGWYGSLSYYGGSPYYGNSWGFGWGYGSGWNYPYYGGSYYNGYFGYNNYWGNNYWGNSNVVVVTENGGRGSVYGKRLTRGGMISHQNENSGNRTRSQIIPRGSDSGNSGGRVATSNSRGQDEYYNRSWRRASEYPSSTGGNSRSSSWSNGSNSNSSWNNSRSSSWSTPSSPSRSSSFESGGTRSSGGFSHSPSSGSGGGGRTRGRD